MKPFHGRQHNYHNLTANEIQYFLVVININSIHMNTVFLYVEH